MTKLSVNVNKIATLRNARGRNTPNVANVSRDILSYGAHGITVHPRPDGRHIRIADVHTLSELVPQFKTTDNPVEFNVEGNPEGEFLDLIETIKPDQCTLVPDPPHALTSNAGWDVAKEKSRLNEVIRKLSDWGVRSSIFIDPKNMNDDALAATLEVKPDRVELYTEDFADAFGSDQADEVIENYKAVAFELYDHGIGINAGHDLNLMNLGTLIQHIPVIDEVSIGHALVSEALYLGLETTVKEYLDVLKGSST